MKSYRIRLGTEYFSRKTAWFESPGFGIYFFAAISRWGKTSQLKNMICQISDYKKCIVFDFYGKGEYQALRFPNFESPYPNSVVHLFTLDTRTHGFFITDFTEGDWITLGMTERGAKFLSFFVYLCGGDLDLILRALHHLPTDAKQFQVFKQDFPEIALKFPLHKETLTNIQGVVNYLVRMNFFIREEQMVRGERVHINTQYLFDILKENHLHINLSLDDNSIGLARFYVGKLLSLFNPKILQYYHPAIFIDEAGKIFKKLDIPEMLAPISHTAMKEYIHHIQRWGVEVWLATQDPQEVEPTIWEFHIAEFLGYVPRIPETTKLRWDIKKNYRQFLYHQVGTPINLIFEPDKLCCLKPIGVT